MTNHIDTCYVGNNPDWNVCESRPTEGHRWSGWPGAWCLELDCGQEDGNEVCMTCQCSCHDKFWESYMKDLYNEEIRRKTLDG